MRITICFGGSIFGKSPDAKKLNKMARSLEDLRDRGHEVLVVTGGGVTARTYIEAARELDVPNEALDRIGIMGTRLNAQLLIASLGDHSPPEPLEDWGAVIRLMFGGKIPVMGGVTPGQTTDAVAAQLADSSKSDLLVFFVDVGGVYTDDPKRVKDAKKIDSMKVSELLELTSGSKFEPGMSTIIDPLAVEILQRTGIRTLVLGEGEISKLSQIVEGGEHDGTVITPE